MHATRSADITILGAGVVGLATAWAAARRGLAVQLVDSAEGPALGASFANGGQLSYAYTDAMAGPALWKQLPGLFAGNDPAFRLKLDAHPAVWRWGLSLLANATSARLRRNTLHTLALAQQSERAMQALLERHPLDFQHRVAGKLHVYFRDAGLEAGRRMMELKRPHGVEQVMLDAAQVLEVEPALAQMTGIRGAVYSPREAAGDPWKFCTDLLGILQDQYGLRSRFGFNAASIRRSGSEWLLQSGDGEQIRARRLVVCAGIHSAALLRPLGARLPLMAVKGYSLTAPCGLQAPTVSITDTARKLVFCRLGDRIRIAGIADINDWSTEPDPRRFERFLQLARESLPGAADWDGISHRWAGLRPSTPTSTPIIANLQEGLTCNAGHGMLGWTLAMGSGERAVALAMGQAAASAG